MGIFGDILSGLTGAAGLGYEISKDQHLTGAQQEANAFTAQQAEIARQWQEDQYLKYNSPAAMMQQYREAGINPMLVAGAKGPGASMSSPSPSSVTPQGSQGVGAGMLQLASLAANIEALKANTVKSKADADKASSEAQLAAVKTQRENIAATFDANLYQADLENRRVQKQNTLAGIAKVEQEIENLKAQKNVSINEAKLKELEQGLTVAKTVLTQSEQNSIDADVYRKRIENTYEEMWGAKPGDALWTAVPGLALRILELGRSNTQKLYDYLTSK